MEYYANIQSDSGRLSSQSALRRWWEAYVNAMEHASRSPRVGQRLQSFMIDAGFRDVTGALLHMPIGGWDSGILVFGCLSLHHPVTATLHFPVYRKLSWMLFFLTITVELLVAAYLVFGESRCATSYAV